MHCENLKRIKVPSSVQEIQFNAFTNCFKLLSVTLPEVLTRIYEGVFDGCVSLVSIDVPSTVTHIEDYAFSNCAMTEHHFRSNIPPTIYRYTFSNKIFKDFKIYVTYSNDHSILNAYKSATYWIDYADKIFEEPQ